MAKLIVVSSFNLGKDLGSFKKGEVYEGDNTEELLEKGLIAPENSKEAKKVLEALEEKAEQEKKNAERRRAAGEETDPAPEKKEPKAPKAPKKSKKEPKAPAQE